MGAMSQQLSTPRRRDAISNRAAILRAAATVFSERGRAVDVREVARCAGVGMGTLYRHFPSKNALIDTLVDESYAHWVDDARRCARSHTCAWDALAEFIADALAFQRRDRALLEHLARSTTDTTGLGECARSLRPLLEELVSAAHSEGALRPGVTADDVLGLLAALGRLVEVDLPDTSVSRCLDIALAGLRHGPALGSP